MRCGASGMRCCGEGPPSDVDRQRRLAQGLTKVATEAYGLPPDAVIVIISRGRSQVSGVRYQVSGISYQAPDSCALTPARWAASRPLAALGAVGTPDRGPQGLLRQRCAAGSPGLVRPRRPEVPWPS